MPAPPDSDADGSPTEAGFALIIGLACHRPPRTNRTVGVVGLKPRWAAFSTKAIATPSRGGRGGGAGRRTGR